MATTSGLQKDQAIGIMVKRIVEQFKPERIILFGSQARGTAGPDSDIDLLVVFHSCINRKSATVSILKSLADLPVSKDIVVTTSEELETRGKLKSTVLHPALHDTLCRMN
ncbi:MAG: nucleotidyltransferase domain-containing protein [bacterium]|jgi:predicted nucleotidyltransferase|nr:nucleotidyltransferase domain-containing protein [bacterium]MDD3805286.1 nucleotidyltransferase domain-containing protein [bacterium]MDD4558470.1 nucleotidyltransferase domain-containing protein [bacterium]